MQLPLVETKMIMPAIAAIGGQIPLKQMASLIFVGMENLSRSQSLDASDRQRIGALGENTEALGLAYYFTGEKKYAQEVAQLLRVWFLDKQRA